MKGGEWLRSGWVWLLLQMSRRIWVRAAFFALISVFAALVAPFVEPPLPEGLADRVGSAAVRDILEVLASSMLVVATFSLGTLISAFAVASSSTTPRVTELLMQDTQAQNAIGVFVGAFLFSLVGLIGLSAGLYGERGGVLLFLVTIAVVVVVVAVFLHWVQLVTHIGRIPDAVDRTAAAAREALRDRIRRPYLDCARHDPTLEAVAVVDAGASGFLRHIDVTRLQEIAEALGARLRVECLPGTFLGPREPLVAADVELPEGDANRIRAAFDIGPRRTFELDPRYGLLALAEIGSKALSPGINDPGTAINVLAALGGVLLELDEDGARDDGEAVCGRVQMPPLAAVDLLDDAFGALARDGAGMLEVLTCLLRTLGLLAESERADVRAAVVVIAERAAAHGHARLGLDRERERVDVLLGAVLARARAS